MSPETALNSPLESLQDPVYETGVDVLQLGLSEQGFGEVAIPRLDDDSAAEHRGRLIGAMAIAMGSLALAAPAAASAEQADVATGVQNTTQTTFELNSDGVSGPIMTALKYRRLNSQCGIASLKISSPAKEPSILGEDIYMNHIILGPTFGERIKRTHRHFARIPRGGVILPVKVCKNEEQGILNGVFTADNMPSGSFTFNWNAKSHRWEKESVDVVK